jgi:predicted nucleic acid-binding protein
MPEAKRIVINTGPLIALVAALENLEILSRLYDQVLVPLEVQAEIQRGGPADFAVASLDTQYLHVWPRELDIPPLLANSLDLGEAAVIQLALNQRISTVCIDETVGRRYARLSGLLLTGSLGVLIRGKQIGLDFSFSEAVRRMQARGIWLSERVVREAEARLGEDV